MNEPAITLVGNPGYWLDSVKYLEAAEREHSMPTLFDLTA